MPSKFLDQQRPDQDLLLPKPRLEHASVLAPPQTIQLFHHHLKYDHLIVRESTPSFIPDPTSRRVDEGGDAPELTRQFVAQTIIMFTGKGAFVVVMQRDY